MAADSLLGDSFTRVTLTSRITECIEQVLAGDSTIISKSFEKELKEAKELCNEEDPDKRVVSFHFLRSLHKAHRQLVSAATGDGEQILYLHELLSGSEVVLPSPPKPKRNPELEARLARLKLEQEEREYQKMVENVSPEKRMTEQLQLGIDMKSTQIQMTVVLNFILTVLGGFVFGYFAGHWLLGWQFTASMILATCVATAIFYADLYFIVKTPHYLEMKLESSDQLNVAKRPQSLKKM